MLGTPLIVIVIFLVIWIVSNVIRAQQDAAQAAAKRPAGRPVGASPPLPGDKGSSDIDRFLQEIDRLRRKGQQESAESKPTAQTTMSTSAESQRPRAQTPARRTAPERKKPPVSERKAAAPPRPAPPPPPPLPPPVLTADDPSMPIVSRLEAKLPDVKSPSRVSAPSRPVRPTQAGAANSPALQMLATIFKSQQAAGVAILLHEILSPPKCKR